MILSIWVSIPMGYRRVIRDLAKIGIGTIIASFIVFIANFLAARNIGPEQYGKYSLIISISNLFLIPMLLNLNLGVTRYLARSNQTEKYISTLISVVVITSSVTCLIAYLFQGVLSSVLGVELIVYQYAIIYSLTLSFKHIFEGILRGKFMFNRIVLQDILMSLFILIFTFIFLFLQNNRQFYGYVIAIMSSFLIYCVLSLVTLKNILKWPSLLDLPKIKKIIHFSLIGTVGNLGNFFINNADKLILNFVLGTLSLGLYAVYSGVATTIVGQMLVVFNTVVFPTSSRLKKRRAHYGKIKKYLYLSFVPLIAFEFFAITTYVLLLGKQYHFNWVLALLVSIATSIFLLYQIPLTFNASRGIRGIKQNVTASLLISLLSLPLNYLAVRYLKIYGLPTVAILLNLTFFVIYNRFLHAKK